MLTKIHIKTKIFSILTIFISIFITLLLLEIILRICGFHTPILYKNNPVTGYSIKENQKIRRFFNNISINDLGLRDERNLIKPKNEYRLGIFGDSVTWGGTYIKHDNLFSSILERLMKQKLNKNVEVYNGGVNGYSVHQIVNRAIDTVPYGKWDLIALLLIERDFYRNSFKTIKKNGAPFYQSDPIFALSEIKNLSICFLIQKFNINFSYPNLPVITKYLTQQEIIKHNFKALKMFHTLMNEKVIPTLVIISPHKKLLTKRSTQYSKLVEEIQNIFPNSIDLLPFFQKNPIKAQQYYYDNVHYSRMGHQTVANILFKYLANSSYHFMEKKKMMALDEIRK